MQATALAKTLSATSVTVHGSCGVNTSLMQPVYDELQQVVARACAHSELHDVVAWVARIYHVLMPAAYIDRQCRA